MGARSHRAGPGGDSSAPECMEGPRQGSKEELLCEGEHLSLKRIGSWEYVERRGKAGGVLIVAVTRARKLLLVEEVRPPAGGRVISLPAGLVGDVGKPEDPAEAAARELREETGYEAEALELLGGGPSSPGLASETVSFFLAHGVRKAGEPSPEERLTLHEVPLREVRAWANERALEGSLIHPLLWAGLYLAFPPAQASEV
jgi:ADP-ribose diphosphatase